MLRLIGFAAGLTLAAVPVAAETSRYTLDPAHTTVAFLVEHVGFAKTLGRFTEVQGSFSYDEQSGDLSDVQIVVETASVKSDNKARDKHVRGKDFLNAKKYPQMTFTASGITAGAENTGTIDGELTLLGQTHPLTLEVALNKADKYPFGHKLFTLGVSARGLVQRSVYGMDYAVANALVGDQVELIIEIEALKE
jgi:polyisoprenoid-binding protein YceI